MTFYFCTSHSDKFANKRSCDCVTIKNNMISRDLCFCAVINTINNEPRIKVVLSINPKTGHLVGSNVNPCAVYLGISFVVDLVHNQAAGQRRRIIYAVFHTVSPDLHPTAGFDDQFFLKNIMARVIRIFHLDIVNVKFADDAGNVVLLGPKGRALDRIDPVADFPDLPAVQVNLLANHDCRAVGSVDRQLRAILQVKRFDSG